MVTGRMAPRGLTQKSLAERVEDRRALLGCLVASRQNTPCFVASLCTATSKPPAYVRNGRGTKENQRGCCQRRRGGEDGRVGWQETRQACSHEGVPGTQPKSYSPVPVQPGLLCPFGGRHSPRHKSVNHKKDFETIHFKIEK